MRYDSVLNGSPSRTLDISTQSGRPWDNRSCPHFKAPRTHSNWRSDTHVFSIARVTSDPRSAAVSRRSNERRAHQDTCPLCQMVSLGTPNSNDMRYDARLTIWLTQTYSIESIPVFRSREVKMRRWSTAFRQSVGSPVAVRLRLTCPVFSTAIGRNVTQGAVRQDSPARVPSAPPRM
jgi:hypothetical protein